VLAVMALLLLAASCGDNATTNDVTSVPPSSTTTTTVATTTTTMATTTTVATTTTALGATPWTTVPDPGMPAVSLTEGFGGPRVVETLCLEVALTGTVTLDPISPEDLAWTMEQMGVAVVDQGCDVTFAIEAHGERYSAEYVTSNGSVITCFNGTELSAELSLSDGTEVLAVWPASRSVAPPEEITYCLEEDRPLQLNTSGSRLPVVVALVEAFGLPAAVFSFARLQEFAAAGDPRLAPISSADEAGDVLAAALHHPDAQVAGAAAERIEDWTRTLMKVDQPYPQRLWDLIPHLIAYGATVDFDTYGGPYAERALVELMFGTDPVMDLHATPEGFDRSDPAAWWRKWEETPEHPPGS